MAYQNVLDLINRYIDGAMNASTTDLFCNMYMDYFYNYSDELEKEVSLDIFEILDDINLLCDSYEADQAIRESDDYCIDEKELREKLKLLAGKLK